MSMSTVRRKKRLTTQLLRAARGQWSPSSAPAGNGDSALVRPRAKLKLPCFPLQQHHFGQLAGAAGVSDNNSSAVAGSVGGPVVATPSDFHSYLCKKIENAQERVVLASLYIGVGSNSNTPVLTSSGSIDNHTAEDQLLQALQHAASKKTLKKVQVLLDYNRALRKVSITKKNRQSHGVPLSGSDNDASSTASSAEAVYSRLNPYPGNNFPNNHNQKNGLFLFPVNDKRLCTILPSPLDEVAGVFHIKAYIVDDELILSGANLSEEYFSNRLDRYMLFVNGGGGLVDFYADLCDILCEYAVTYEGQSSNNSLPSLFSLQDEKARKEKLEVSLMHLFNGENKAYSYQSKDSVKTSSSGTPPIVAYAVPTFQMPTSFLGRQFQFQCDAQVTRNLLISALGSEQSASIRLSSAYLNLTPKLLSVLTRYRKENQGAPYILTAGAISHGFAQKAGSPKKIVGIVDKIKETIPEAFLTLVKETAQSIIVSGGKVLLYERPGWTFHAKGVWITANNEHGCDSQCPEIMNNPQSLLATIIGSGNYGARSEDLDVESNCMLIFNDSNSGEGKTIENDICKIKENVAAEWNNMCELSNELTDVSVANDSNKFLRVVLEFMKRFL